jgi:ATP-dependent protease Clp ATPase subunit
MATRIEPDKAPSCSWCRKSQDEVNLLIATPTDLPGPRAYICEECVAVCNSILEDRGIEPIWERMLLNSRIGGSNTANSANNANAANPAQEGALQ